MRRRFCMSTVLAMGLAVAAPAMSAHAQTAPPGPAATAAVNTRLPDIPIAQYTDEQKTAAAEFEAARKYPPVGPFIPLMHSPRVMNQARAMGDYLRFGSAIGTTLSELAILMTARDWSQDYEWHIHAPIAEKAGISRAIIDAIRDGRRPDAMSADEAVIYDFSSELLRNKRVSDATFERMDKRFGKKGVIDLTGIHGYYALLAMQMNVARYTPPEGMTRLPRLPD